MTKKVWEHYGTLRLGGEAFETAGADDVPGYDDADDAGMILIRRKSDGKVFEVEIEPIVRAGRELEAMQDAVDILETTGEPEGGVK